MSWAIFRTGLFAVLLLLAQVGAATHAFVHGSHDEGSESTSICEWCVGYAHLGMGATGAAHAAPLVPPVPSIGEPPVEQQPVSRVFPHHVRAPPSFFD